MQISENQSNKNMQNLTTCWSCMGPVRVDVLFCHTCGSVLPPKDKNSFSIMGLNPSFDVKIEDVERRYLQLQRQIHPDRFVERSKKEQEIAQIYSSNLNQAFETIKDPVLRGAELLKLRHINNIFSDSETINDPALLLEIMEKREWLETMTTDKERNQFKSQIDKHIKSLIDDFQKFYIEEKFEKCKNLIISLKYYMKILNDFEIKNKNL